MVAICFFMVIYLFYNPNKIFSEVIYFVLNISLLLSVFKLILTKNNLRSVFLEWLGINSLGIYLWHVIPILLVKFIYGTDDLIFFYLLTFVLEILFIFSYKLLLKVDFVKRYIFGV